MCIYEGGAKSEGCVSEGREGNPSTEALPVAHSEPEALGRQLVMGRGDE